MCGIAGFIGGTLSEDQAHSDLNTMANSIRHRGPDSQNIFFSPELTLGLAHTRLSIIDLSEFGSQPMRSHSGRYQLVFNGEIYNFKTIRAKLEAQNVKFRGRSDTEVFLSIIDNWGLEYALELVHGMFSFALYDYKAHRLTLARDRSGEKPLYYSLSKGALIFASELNSLKQSSHWQDEIDPDHLALFVRHNYVPAPFSIYKNTFKLPPGTYIQFEVNQDNRNIKNFDYFSPFAQESKERGKTTPIYYWRLSEQIRKEPLEGDIDTLTDKFSHVLRDVVYEQMVSDVPLGAFLSGGVDSSLIATMMQLLSRKPIQTFSIGFTQKEFNEAEYAKSVAKHLGTNHTELYVSPEEAQKVIPELPAIYDEPFADSSQIPTYLVARMAREKVTVALSGDGGDELFGGYNRYLIAQQIWNYSRRLPSLVKNLGAKSIQSVSPGHWDSIHKITKPLLPKNLRFSMFGDKLYKASEVLKAETKLDTYLSLVSHCRDPERLVNNYNGDWNILKQIPTDLSLSDFREKMMYLDFMTYLPDDILVKVDRAAMAVSLETRVPLLDRRVVEFAWNLPMDNKIDGSVGKKIMRNLLHRHVPPELIDRPKMGFAIPLGDWMRGPLKEWASDLLSEDSIKSAGYFNNEVVQKYWKEHKSGDHNWQGVLWNILMFQQWHEAQK